MINNIKLLILEDNKDDASLIKATLKRAGSLFNIKVVSTRIDFIYALDSFIPEVILSDHRLPQFSSTQALKICRDKLPYIPFILVTGTVSDEFAATIIKEGADDYILKNNLKRLPTAIEQAINKKQNEKAQALLISIINSSDDAIISTGLDNIITSWNTSAEKTFGYGKTEAIGKNISLIIPPDRSAEEPQIMEKIKNGELINHYETKRRKKNGDLVHVSLTVSPIKDERGNIIGVSKISRDITGRIESERQKEFEHNNLSALINNTSDLMWSVDKDLKLITSNNAFNQVITLTTGRPVVKGSKILSTQFTREQVKRYKELYKKALSGDSFTEVDYFDDPVEFWAEISFNPIRLEDRVIGTACFSRNITNRKKAEEELRRSEMRLNKAQAIAHISNWEFDFMQNTHIWSDEFYRIYGLIKSEVIPSAELFLSFMHADDAEFAQKKVKEAFDSLKDSSFDFRFIRKDGKMRHGYIEWRFEFDKSGKPSRLFGILQDVTEREEAEEALKSMELKMLNQKVQEQKKIARAMIMGQEQEKNHLGRELHDNVNQLLAGTKLYLAMAGNKNAQLKELIKYPLELIDNSIEEIRLLCREMVTPLKNIDLKELVERLLQKLSQTTMIKTDFSYSVPDGLLSDDRKLNAYRIIQEQINNISKYADAKNVSISIKQQDKAIHIITSDDGKGFEVSSERKGIGISNMINRVESYNGHVVIKSSPGNGCEFQISIPS